MRVLVTRPLNEAARTAERLKKLGHEALIESLLHLEPLAAGAIPEGPFAAVAVTSANAVRVAAAMVEVDRLRTLPIFTVGAASAEAAREAGFKSVRSADGAAAALVRLLAQQLPRGARVLHLAGEDRAQDLAASLKPHGIEVGVFVIYRMRAAQQFSDSTAAALASDSIDAVLHYSPRSAATFAAIVARQGLVNATQKLRHYCLSPAVAAELAELGAPVKIAEHPNEADLLRLLAA